MLVVALVVVAGLATWALRPVHHVDATHGITLVTAAPFSAARERIGGCREARLDHGRDRDPTGARDQEDDECISGWMVQRQPDGAPQTIANDAG